MVAVIKLSDSPFRSELHTHVRDFSLSTFGLSRSLQNFPCIGFLLNSSGILFSVLDFKMILDVLGSSFFCYIFLLY